MPFKLSELQKKGNSSWDFDNSLSQSSGSGSGVANRDDRTMRRFYRQAGSNNKQVADAAGTLFSTGKRMLDENQNLSRGYMDAAKANMLSPEEAADRAGVEVGLQHDRNREMNIRNMTRYGINPNSGRFQGAEQDWALVRAAAIAGAKNDARFKTRNLNFNQNMQLAGIASGDARAGLGAMSGGMSGYSTASSGAANIGSIWDKLSSLEQQDFVESQGMGSQGTSVSTNWENGNNAVNQGSLYEVEQTPVKTETRPASGSASARWIGSPIDSNRFSRRITRV